MGLHVLIAEARDIRREGLRSIFANDLRVAHIYEAANNEDLRKHLEYSSLDLVVIHQSLVTDITILPRGHFVILTAEPNEAVLLAAWNHGARGYLLEDTSAELLLMTLDLAERQCLLDPALAPWLLKDFHSDRLTGVRTEVLTPREREVFSLMHDGLPDAEIAARLCVAPATVRTYVASILCKMDITRRQVKSLPLPEGKYIRERRSRRKG